MRKLIFVLMLALSFALGSVSQHLLAGNGGYSNVDPSSDFSNSQLAGGVGNSDADSSPGTFDYQNSQLVGSPPTLHGTFCLLGMSGTAKYNIPSGWKLISIPKANKEALWIEYQKEK